MPSTATPPSCVTIQVDLDAPQSIQISDPDSILRPGLMRQIRKLVKTAITRSTSRREHARMEVLIRMKQPLNMDSTTQLLKLLETGCEKLLVSGKAAYPFSKAHQLDLAIEWKPCDDSGRSFPGSPISKSDTVSGDAPLVETMTSREVAAHANRTLDEIDLAMKPIISKINHWLAELEGITYPVDQPTHDIDLIRQVVRRAGCQLFYQETPVQIRPVRQATGRFLTIQVRALGSATVGTLYAAKSFPRLEARPYPKNFE